MYLNRRMNSERGGVRDVKIDCRDEEDESWMCRVDNKEDEEEEEEGTLRFHVAVTEQAPSVIYAIAGYDTLAPGEVSARLC